jgi:hypothetical protein
MIELYTSGYGFSQRRCRDAVTWFCKTYLPRHHITVEVLHRGLKREQVIGWCSVQDCNWRPRDFLIELQSGLKEEQYFTTLFHELYHCYQHIRGDLRDKRGIRCWKGIDCSQLDYENHPWELEAYQKEQELYEDYIKSLGA